MKKQLKVDMPRKMRTSELCQQNQGCGQNIFKEKQASEIYARKIYKKFLEQLQRTTTYEMKELEKNGVYTVTKVQDLLKLNAPKPSCIVKANVSESSATSQCKLYEFAGMLCTHIMKVFLRLRINQIPEHYIMKRWTRMAKERMVHISSKNSDSCRKSKNSI